MGEIPDSIILVESKRAGRGARPSGGREARLRHPDDALGRRDRRRDHRAPRAVPVDPRAAARGHLLRDLEPPVGGQGAARRDRPAARDRLAQLVELEPARRDGARRRRAVVPDRRRDRDRRGVDRGRHDGRRHHLGRLRPREARPAALRLVPRARRHRHRGAPLPRGEHRVPPSGRAAPRARARRFRSSRSAQAFPSRSSGPSSTETASVSSAIRSANTSRSSSGIQRRIRSTISRPGLLAHHLHGADQVVHARLEAELVVERRVEPDRDRPVGGDDPALAADALDEHVLRLEDVAVDLEAAALELGERAVGEQRADPRQRPCRASGRAPAGSASPSAPRPRPRRTRRS